MFRQVVLFELRYHRARVSTYVFAFVLCAFPFMVMSSSGAGVRRILNSPHNVANAMVQVTSLAVLIVAGLAGMAVVRDFEDGIYQLFFTTRLRRRDYLGGRLVGSLIVMLLILAAIPVGMGLGTLTPWSDRAHMAPAGVWTYVQPYLVFVVTGACSTGMLFFAVGALSRSVMVVYLQGVAFVAIYLVVSALLPGDLDRFWPALLDPFGISTLAEATKYWSPAEINTRFVPLSGVLLWNRLLWVGLGLLAAAAAFAFFPHSAESLVRPRASRTPPAEPETAVPSTSLPAVGRRFDRGAVVAQFLSLTRLRLLTITSDPLFLALVGGTIASHLMDAWGAPRMSGALVYPVTYVMAERLDVMLPLLIITTIYAGELVWRERTIRYDQVHDSLPMSSWLNAATQFVALAGVQIMLLTGLVLISMVTQAGLGYFRFEPGVYFKIVFLEGFSGLLPFTALAIAAQTFIPNRFLGHSVVLGALIGPPMILRPIAARWHWTFPTELYWFAIRPAARYSDMNHYGPFVSSLVWYSSYWLAAACVLLAVTVRFTRRGAETGWRTRWRQGRWGHGARAMAMLGLLAFVGLGVAIYAQERIYGRYVPPHSMVESRARYERELKTYERLPQPRVTDVELAVDLYPRQSTFSATGTITLVNKSAQSIPAVHVSAGAPDAPWEWVRFSFDRPGHDVFDDEGMSYRIHQFDRPLAPGDSVKLQFASGRDKPPLDRSTPIIENGTFFSLGSWLPSIGYDRNWELTNEDERREQHLPVREDLPPWNDEWGRSRNAFAGDADWVTFRTTVSTDADQVAVAPGYLEREWTEGGRRYFRYDMGSTPIHKFFTFVSGRYRVTRDRWNDVDIAVYHDPKHPYNVERMIQAVKAGLEYFTSNFGPFQFREFRILEFPRHVDAGAQSFPTTVPYSEALGFIARATADDDLDYAFSVTLHELAHQWWGHQVAGSVTEGSKILSETMAEYSALMVIEHVLGPDRLRLYMRHNLDEYLQGRRDSPQGEQPLARVTRGTFVWYAKGSLAMYALKDAIGEATLNGALRQYIERVKFQQPPYTTAGELLDALRAVTPAETRHLIDDLFEHITLFDNRTSSATWRRLADGRYAVTLAVTARKLRADDMGREREVPIDDAIDIGVFTGSGLAERVVFLEKRRITSTESTIEVIVNERPDRAGIDPYTKLIDRIPGDNVVAVREGGAAP